MPKPRSRLLAEQIIAEALQERYEAACQAVGLTSFYIKGGLKFMATQPLTTQRKITEEAEAVAAGSSLVETL